MNWMIKFKVKDYVRNWSDQKIYTEYKGVNADIKIKDTNCIVILNGDENIKEVFRLIWELLFLYDGYFYEPMEYEIDGQKGIVKNLFFCHFIRPTKSGIVQSCWEGHKEIYHQRYWKNMINSEILVFQTKK